jgi:hypothetical protein
MGWAPLVVLGAVPLATLETYLHDFLGIVSIFLRKYSREIDYPMSVLA